MRIVFMGTPEFAVEPLKALIREGYEIAGVFTQPDRPKGRGKKMVPGPVKIAAEEAGIPVFQPERIRKTGVEDPEPGNTGYSAPWQYQRTCVPAPETSGSCTDCLCHHER